LLQGELAIFLADRTQVSGQIRAGTLSFRDLKAHVGDLAMYSDEPATATVVTQDKCVCLVLRREQAMQFAALLPEFRANAELMAVELRRLRSASWTGFQDALQVKGLVEASKLKVNRLLAAQKLELMSKLARAESKEKGENPLGKYSLPPLLRLKEVPVDLSFVPPADSDIGLPKEMIKVMRRQSFVTKQGGFDSLSRDESNKLV
jgi:hypothetical protein